jgi:ribosome-binding protein aMBF1 (putative translation factor)
VKLQVCSDCAQHDDTTGKDQSRDDDNREKRAAQNTARMHDAGTADAEHWEDGADYEDDQLPYLKRDYGRAPAGRVPAGGARRGTRYRRR